MARRRSNKSEKEASPEPALEPVPVEEPTPEAPPPPLPVDEEPAPKPKPNSTPKPASVLVTGQAARDPNRVAPTGQLRVAVAVWAGMASIPLTSRAGFAAWCRTQGHTAIRTPTDWASLYEAYGRHPVGRK